MKGLKDIQRIYFVGVGGIGMSALARYLKLLNKEVYGYDKTSTKLTDALIDEGIEVTFQDSVLEIPHSFNDIEGSLVVYTPAIPKTNLILNHFIQNGHRVIKRAQLLGEVTADTLCLAVAGTHGKTTTSAILGHLLRYCDMPITAFLGGIAENYNSNFIYNGNDITIVEADEFDRSFLHLMPDIACITSMDADHLDIYGDASSIEESFIAFAQLLPNKNQLLFKKGLSLNGMSVAIEEEAHIQALNLRIEDGAYHFDFKMPEVFLKNMQFHLPGHHNLYNAITALGMAILAGAPADRLSEALLSFKGEQRRFSYKIKQDDLVLIDDYAHHPTELDALYQAVHEMYPKDSKLIVFQPHLYSRTRDFIDGFAKSLSRFDEIILLDIYPAREVAIEGVDSSWLLGKINEHCKTNVQKRTLLISKEELSRSVEKSNCRIKLIVGAGDIGAEVERVTKYLRDAS